MKKIELILFCIFILISCNHDENSLNTQSPQKHLDSFFSTIKDQDINIALDSLFATNERFIKESKSDVDNVKLQLSNMIAVIGKYRGAEIIFHDKIGESLFIYSYLVKYDKQPLRFTFVFYKANDKWMLYNFKFDTDIVDELNKKSAIYLLDDHS